MTLHYLDLSRNLMIRLFPPELSKLSYFIIKKRKMILLIVMKIKDASDRDDDPCQRSAGRRLAISPPNKG